MWSDPIDGRRSMHATLYMRPLTIRPPVLSFSNGSRHARDDLAKESATQPDSQHLQSGAILCCRPSFVPGSDLSFFSLSRPSETPRRIKFLVRFYDRLRPLRYTDELISNPRVHARHQVFDQPLWVVVLLFQDIRQIIHTCEIVLPGIYWILYPCRLRRLCRSLCPREARNLEVPAHRSQLTVVPFAPCQAVRYAPCLVRHSENLVMQNTVEIEAHWLTRAPAFLRSSNSVGYDSQVGCQIVNDSFPQLRISLTLSRFKGAVVVLARRLLIARVGRLHLGHVCPMIRVQGGAGAIGATCISG